MKIKTIELSRRRNFFSFFALLFLTFTVLPATAQMMYKQNDEFSFSRYYYGNVDEQDRAVNYYYSRGGTSAAPSSSDPGYYYDSYAMSAVPIYVMSTNSYNQNIYSKDSLVAGTIKSIAFYSMSTFTTSNLKRNLDIYIKEVDRDDFYGWFDITTGATKVFSGNVTVPTTQGWQSISFTTNFVYSGTKNIVVAIYDHTGSTTTNTQVVKYRVFTETSNTHRYLNNLTTSPATTTPGSGTSTKMRPWARFGIEPLLTEPVFAPTAGTFNEPQEVTITNSSDEVSIYYTTDGTTPSTTNGALYTGPIYVDANTIIKAVTALGNATSGTATATYEFQPLSPTFQNTGIHSESATVAIVAGDTYTESIYYTTDGTTPSATNGTLYTGPFTVTTETTVKAVAVKTGWSDSQVETGHYMILKPNGMTPSQNPEGLVMDKSFTPDGTDGNNSGILTLESYVTGSSITVSNVVPPTDIVLVLDYSASMINSDIPYTTSGGVESTQKRIDALKTSVSSFLDQIAAASNQPSGEFAGMHHRVAFVTYGTQGRMWYGNPSSLSQVNKGDTTAYTATGVFNQAFYEVNGSGYSHSLAWSVLGGKYGSTNDSETELQFAMPLVQGIFDNNSTEIPGVGNRNRMVVVFTDGGIGSGHWMGAADPNNIGYAEGKANYTLRKANLMKNSYGATFYSVGIFPTNPTGHQGGSSPYYSSALPTYHSPYINNNPVTYNEYSSEWADNVSRFMALRSSNYPNSTSMTNPGTGSNSNGYFIIATDANQLTNAFATISQTIATPSVSLGTQTVVEDVISDAFMLPEGTSASDIKVYTANCTGVSPYTFDTPVLWNGAQVSIDGKHILVTNFDFAANWCGENSTTHVVQGKKLILEIPIERDYTTTTSGGTFNTNGEESGVYNESGSQVGAFQSPQVELSGTGDVCFDFEDVEGTAYNAPGNLPDGWHGYLHFDNSSSYVVAPHVVSGSTHNFPHDGTRSLLLASGYYTNGISYVTMPAMYFTSGNDMELSFYYRTEGTGNGECSLAVGYVTSIPADNASDWVSAFQILETLPASTTSENGSIYTVSLSSVPTNQDVYIAFKWYPNYNYLTAERFCYLDGVCVQEPEVVRLWTQAVKSLNDVPTGGFVVDGDGNVTINCEEGLAWLISYVNGLNGSDPHTLEGKTVTVTKPLIDMSEYIWVPIGYNTTHPFKGTFDACDNLISGVHVDGRQQEFIYVEDKYGPMVYAGMFGYTDGATVKNLSFLLSGDAAHYGKDHISSRCENGYLGALVAYGKDLNMELCYVFNGVVAYGNLESVGGLVGHAEGTGAIKACMSGAHLGAGLWNGSSNQIVIENLGGIVGSTGEGYAVKDGFSAFVDLQLKYYGSSLTAAGVENLGAVVGKGYATSNVYVHPLSLSLSTTVDGGTAPTNSYWYALEDENFDNVTGFTEAVPRTYGSYSVNNTINGRPLVDVLNDHVTPGFKWMTPPSPDVNLGYPVIVKEDDEAYAYFSLAVLDEHFLYLMRSDVNKIGTIATQLLSSKSSGEKADDDDDDDDESSMGIYMYSNGNISLGIPALINMHIDENVAVTQSTAEDVNTSVGITIKNPNGSGAEHRDWHTFATPLKQVPLGIKYCEADQSHTGYAPGADNFLVFGPEGVTSYDYAIDENGYFPAGIANRTQFDLYSYYEPEYHWINLKRKPNNHWHEDEVEGSHPQINYDGETGQTVLEQGKGYLVGLGTTTENNNYMQARGALTNGVVKHAVTAAGGNLKGYNLLGNPYQSYLDFHEFASVNEDVLWGEGNTTDTGYMAYLIFDAERNRFEQYLVDDDYIGFSDGAATTTSRYLNMHQGFFVVKRTEDPSASNVSDSVVFNNDMRVITPNAATYRSDVQPAYPLVNLFCTDADGNQEIVIMELERPLKAGSTKMKGMLNGKCNMYAHWGNDDLGAVFIDYMPDYVPVWFEAAEDGVFTITWSTANENFGYMHLIDNIAGVDYDCLAPGNDSYTFHATTTDMIARFRVVFKPMGIEEEISEHGENFAFFNGNELIVNGEGDMRLTDLNGRCVYTQHLAGQQNSVSLPVVADGMYLLQLNGAEGVKVQKIVIRK